MEKAGTRQPPGPGPFKFGEQYKIGFHAKPQYLQHVEKRYVYVSLSNSLGASECLFPRADDPNEANLLPLDGPIRPRIEATRLGYDIKIEEPEGIDNYVFVTSRDYLNPGLFEWPEVGSGRASAKHSPANPI